MLFNDLIHNHYKQPKSKKKTVYLYVFLFINLARMKVIFHRKLNLNKKITDLNPII